MLTFDGDRITKMSDVNAMPVGQQLSAVDPTTPTDVLRQVIEKKYDRYPGSAETAYWMWRRGEPYVSGWTPREAAAFATEVIRHLETPELLFMTI